MKKYKNKILRLIAILSLGFFIFILFNALYATSTDEIPLPPSLAQKITTPKKISSPSFLLIPKIKVNAEIQPVGLSLKGNMAVPGNFSKVGWYKYGAFPGEKGNAVLAGHLDNGLALPGVFNHLSELSPGDDVYVKTGNKTLHFSVTKSEVYDFNAKVDEVFKNDNGKFLKLITCMGSWLEQYRTHDKRLVLSAVLI